MQRISQDARALLKTLYTNMSVAQNREQMFDETIISCSRALDIDASATKPMFLRGSAFLALGKFDEAMNDAIQAIKLEPQDKQIRSLYE